MAYIFMDESGDLGFDFTKDKTSRYFVITFLMIDDPKPGSKIIKNIIAWLSRAERKRFNWVLHFHREHPKMRMKALSQLSKLNASIMSIYVDKQRVYTHLQEEKHVLYNYITNILIDRIVNKKLLPTDNLQLIVAKRETNKFLNQNFHNYITKKALEDHHINVTVSIESYHESNHKCLQLVDAACWTIFRKREHHDDSYYQIIKNLIIEENKLFW
jgi:undecaprenyl pyrophosphate synthase